MTSSTAPRRITCRRPTLRITPRGGLEFPSAPCGPACDHQERPEQDQDLDRPLDRSGLMAARRRAEDQAHQKCGREADHSESAKQRMSSHAERPRVLCRLCSAGSKTPNEADNAAPQRRPPDRVVTRYLTPFVPGSIGGGAKSAAASMPCIGKPASVLVETCLHLIYLFLKRDVSRPLPPGRAAHLRP